MDHPAYVVVSPVRNEAVHIRLTIESMTAQTVPPMVWVIVDDGSTDDTGRIIREAAARIPWIRTVHRSDRGQRRAGIGVMEAFYDGYRLVENLSWDFIVKLDGDLSFGPDYFESCMARFQAEPGLGMGGGLVCKQVGAGIEEEFHDPPFHVRGPTKIYRHECWRAIGGLIQLTGWDTFDQTKANMLGWQTRTFQDIRIVHHRPTGGAYGSWSNWTKNGLANYIVGYHPVFMVLKCTRRVFKRPYVVAGLGLMFGFVKGYAKRIPQVQEPEVIRYLRKQQMDCLFGRKSLWRNEPAHGLQSRA